MPHVKIGSRHQITIPKEIFEELQLEVGDLLEVSVENTKVVITPKRVVGKMPVQKLSSNELKLLKSAKKKIEIINTDYPNSTGLTEDEAKVAAKAGLIDPDQIWWWLEEWQRSEREAQKDIDSGKVETFSSPEAFLNSLR